MRLATLRRLVPIALLPLAVLLPAGVAHAAPGISIQEGTNFTQSQTITISYTGFTAYERGFIQQCVKGDVPDFDFSADCIGTVTQVTALLDKTDGTLKFRMFVGDDPAGSFPYACGPSAVPGSQSFDTCYIRVVQTSQSDNEHDLFVPITFSGAVAGAAVTPPTVPVVTTAPGSQAGASTSAAAAAGSTPPSTSADGAAPTTAAPKVTAVITRRAKTNVVRSFVLPALVTVAGIGVGALIARKRRPAVIARAQAVADRSRIDVDR